MNSGFTEGTAWRGRVLVGLDTQPAKDAKLMKTAIAPSSTPPTTDYVAFLEYALCLQVFPLSVFLLPFFF